MNERIEFTKENLLIGLDQRIKMFKKELEADENARDCAIKDAKLRDLYKSNTGIAMYSALIEELSFWKKFIIEAREVQNG